MRTTDWYNLAAPNLLSYIPFDRHLVAMDEESRLSERRWWLATIVVGGAWIAGMLNGLLKWH